MQTKKHQPTNKESFKQQGFTNKLDGQKSKKENQIAKKDRMGNKWAGPFWAGRQFVIWSE